MDNDGFRVPSSGPGRSCGRAWNHNRSRNNSRESSYDRSSNHLPPPAPPPSTKEPENWREEIRRSRHNSLRESEPRELEARKGGIIVLPPQPKEEERKVPNYKHEQPRYPDLQRKPPAPQKKTLFDPNNPNKPIVVKASGARVNVPGFSDENNPGNVAPLNLPTDQLGNVRPGWYEEDSDNWKMCRFPLLLKQIRSADYELQCIISSGSMLSHWEHVAAIRDFLQQSLNYLLIKVSNLKQTMIRSRRAI